MQEKPMDSKKPNRRRFLKGGALAAGLAAGVVRVRKRTGAGISMA